MQKRKFVIKLLTVILFLIISGISRIDAAGSFYNSVMADKPSATEDEIFPLIILGEVRRVTTLESFYIWESFVNGGSIDIAPEDNDKERLRVVRKVSGSRPAMVMLPGNLVNYGAKEHNWVYFDELFRTAYTKKIPLCMLMGEHEYWGRDSQARKYIVRRFPLMEKTTWYSKNANGITMICLNSNRGELSDDEWDEQLTWYENVLKTSEEDPEIKGVIVMTHHAPFTNSETGESEVVKASFIPQFISANKTMLFVSGNSATYERFDMYGKAFIVTGGGGAPRDELVWNENSRKDEYRRQLPVDGNKYRPFHYVRIDTTPRGLSVKVTGLNKGNVIFFTMEEFELKFPLNVITKQTAE